MTEQTFVDAAPGRGFDDLTADERAALTSAIISDSLDVLGLREQTCRPGLSGLGQGDRVLGRASTVQFAPHELDSEDPYADAVSFIDGLHTDSVPVIAAGGDDRTAYWGELFSAAAKGRGASGTICDGPVRDVAKIAALGFPVFAMGRRPVDFRARMAIVSQGQPVRVRGVLVSSGDLVLADADGVVVVPAAVEVRTLELALARARAESQVLAALLSGAKLAEVWQRWGIL